MLYTRKGDNGTSGLFGTKERLPKDHLVFDALGSIDELNSLTGLCRAYVRECGHDERELLRAQEVLFVAQAELAGSEKRVTKAHVDALERAIGDIEASIEKPSSFVIPGATVLSALYDCARAVARRAERAVVRSQEAGAPQTQMQAYLNRLSSFFYALARHAAQTENTKEKPPTYDLAT